MFEELIDSLGLPLAAGSRAAIGPLAGSGGARLLAELQPRLGLTLVITPDSHSASALERELRFHGRARGADILALPDWETLPYDNFSPHQDITSQRLLSLYRLPHLRAGLLIAPCPTLMHRLPPKEYISGNSLVLETGQALNAAEFLREMERNGYRSVETVYERGEFARRGALVDIYPMGAKLPYRIDLFDDEVETLRSFDPETQRTVEKIDSIRLLPAREFPLSLDAIRRFRGNWHEQFNVDHDACPMYSEISAGRAPGGAEYYLPLFFERCDSLFDYLPEGATIAAIGEHYSAAQQFWGEVASRRREYGIDPRRPLLPPEAGFIPVEELYERIRRHPCLELRVDPAAPVKHRLPLSPPPDLSPRRPGESPTARIKEFMDEQQAPVLLCAESPGRREILLELLSRHDLHPAECAHWEEFIERQPALGITVAPVDRGLYAGPGQPSLVCEAQLFGDRVAQRRRRAPSGDAPAASVYRDVNELRPGVPVVHLEHGVGRYRGLQSLKVDVDSEAAEFLLVEYAGGDKLYVPVASLHLLSPYIGADPESAPLHRLGGEQWEKARRKAREKINDVAAELLEVYARREARQGFACPPPGEDYQAFAAAFPFEETPDQAAAIAQVIEDMCGPGVMDRLVCGDVGFGKTEVAMRAAFLAARAGKQVAVLVPTTLLAQQHFHSFCDRFAGWEMRIEVLSRFRSAAEQNEVMERAAAGGVDILIGTHKLLHGKLRFHDLGLLVIDEEHRFGVKQKEALKKLRAEVDILTLTATPIPRTLNMALGGLRDLSIIATPPPKRLSIKTFVREHSIALIKEAVLRETLRGGQVYYLHNEVKTIEMQASLLRELLPELRIAVAHGQMREAQLEQVMRAFYHQQHHLLLCSTIIETGIDVPNANTIIIARADKLGLAQLHQLRGRVGRSHHQAYAYLLRPPPGAITRDAQKRLEAIASAGELGAGYMLATHDLEIRGAGELLGEEQSGQIHGVGYSLYMQMLERAVAALRSGELPAADGVDGLDGSAEVNLRIPALIPEPYLPDINARLVLYKRIAAAGCEAELDELKAEMVDRFGPYPPPIANLFRVTAVKLAAAAIGIRKIDAGEGGGFVEFCDNTAVDPLELVRLVQAHPEDYRLTGSNRLRFTRAPADAEARCRFAGELIEALAGAAREAAA